jgi:hypothetical protein
MAPAIIPTNHTGQFSSGQAGAASFGEKSSSTLAPLGSKQNNCQTPDSGCLRKSYLIPFDFSLAAMAGKSDAEKAM